MDTPHKEIFDRLLLVAKRHGIANQSELARVLGVTRQVVTDWKRRGVPLERLDDAARRFGTTLEYLRTGRDVARFHHQLTEEQRRLLEAVSILDETDKKRLLDPIYIESERIRRYIKK